MLYTKVRLLRLPEVIELTGLSRASIYRQMAAGTFPQSVKIGVRAVAWKASDLVRWLESRPASHCDFPLFQ